jgi:uncharacterized protein YndB with AHSA1/START domain
MEHIVKKTIDIVAEPTAVWEALTNPALTKKYFFKSKVISKWGKGDKITFKGRMFFFIKFKMTGEILEIEPEKLLKYTLKNTGDEENGSSSTVTDELSYKDGITTLTITDDVGQGEGAEKRFKRSDKGWEKILKGLKKVVERGA